MDRCRNGRPVKKLLHGNRARIAKKRSSAVYGDGTGIESFLKKKTMEDNVENLAPVDRSKVSLTESWEIEYWTRALNCKEQDLRNAIQTVGNSTDTIRHYFEE